MLQLAAVLWPVLLAGQGDLAIKRADQKEIQRAVEQLADDSYAVRHQAAEFLWKCGVAAEPAVRVAADSKDAEVAVRARELLDKFKYGIYPDTPPEIVRLVHTWRSGDRQAKLIAFDQLQKQKAVKTLLALLEAETDPQLRAEILQRVVRNGDTAIPQLLLDGNFGQAEELLRLGASIDDRMLRDYVAFLHIEGKLELRLAELQKADSRAGAVVDKLLAAMLRANGDLAGALVVARRTPFIHMEDALLFELGDWRALAARAKVPDLESDVPAQNIEPLGLLTAYQRLAGNEREFAESINNIQEQAAAEPAGLWYYFEALAINDRPTEAVELLRAAGDFQAFNLLARQGRFREAFSAAGVRDIRAPVDQWFKPVAGLPNEGRAAQFANLLRAAKLLDRLGENEPARKLLIQVGKGLGRDQSHQLGALAQAELQLGMQVEALATAGLAIEGPPSEVLQSLFPQQAAHAAVWWEFFTEKYAGESNGAKLQRVRRMLDVPALQALDHKDFVAITDAAYSRARTLPQVDRWQNAIAAACMARGDTELAIGYLPPFQSQAAMDNLMRLGDLLLKNKRPSEAARWYKQSWELSRQQDATALYLLGRTKANADEAGEGAEEGRKLMKLAAFVPLSDGLKRHGLATGLQARGFAAEAQTHSELALRFETFEAWPAQALQEVGNAASSRGDFRQAAARWEQLALSVLRTSTTFGESEAYLQLPHLIHKSRGRGLLAEGKIAQGLREFRLAQQYLPADCQLPIDVSPRLAELDRQGDADQLFDAAFEANEAACADFPRAAGLHNDLAWMSARCGRKLAAGLRHAERAVELMPHNAAYLDTLAEVQLQSGQQQLAISSIRRALVLSPDEAYLKRQLGRMQQNSKSSAPGQGP